MKSSVEESTGPGLYVHVPFCLTKCPYCDFCSITNLAGVDDFLIDLAREASLYKDLFPAFDTLYVGGGTPSVLTPGQMVRLFRILRGCFHLEEPCEITVEVNPDDVTREKLDTLRAVGVNRLSIGVQSFRDRDLAFLGRRHKAGAGRKAIERVVEAGFSNLSIDLIYGLPGQTKNSWTECLAEALAYPVTHLSCYGLTVEEETPFGRMRREGRLKSASEKKEADLFLLTSEFLEARGFTQYEISNYARTAEDGLLVSRHNSKYWAHVPYLGLGPSAHSFNGAKRWWNGKSLQAYHDRLGEGRPPVEGEENLGAEELRLERLYLGLRTKRGVKSSEITFGAEGPTDSISRLVHEGLIEIIGERVVPTRKGFLVADRLPLLF